LEISNRNKRTLNNEDHHNLYFSPGIVMINSKKKRLKGLLLGLGNQNISTKCWLKGPTQRDSSEDLGTDGSKIKKTGLRETSCEGMKW